MIAPGGKSPRPWRQGIWAWSLIELVLMAGPAFAFENTPAMPFRIVLLVCSADVQHSDCTSASALDVTQGPRVANELMCGRDAQALLAGTVIAPRPGTEYAKILCVRDADRG